MSQTLIGICKVSPSIFDYTYPSDSSHPDRESIRHLLHVDSKIFHISEIVLLAGAIQNWYQSLFSAGKRCSHKTYPFHSVSQYSALLHVNWRLKNIDFKNHFNSWLFFCKTIITNWCLSIQMLNWGRYLQCGCVLVALFSKTHVQIIFQQTLRSRLTKGLREVNLESKERRCWSSDVSRTWKLDLLIEILELILLW